MQNPLLHLIQRNYPPDNKNFQHSPDAPHFPDPCFHLRHYPLRHLLFHTPYTNISSTLVNPSHLCTATTRTSHRVIPNTLSTYSTWSLPHLFSSTTILPWYHHLCFANVHLQPFHLYALFTSSKNIDHAMICRRGGFIIQRHNELRDLEPELLNIVCNDVQIESVLGQWSQWRSPKFRIKQISWRPTWRTCTWLLGETKICILWCPGMTPKCRVLHGSDSQTDLPHAREWKETRVQQTNHRNWTRNIYAADLYHNWRNGKGVSHISVDQLS